MDGIKLLRIENIVQMDNKSIVSGADKLRKDIRAIIEAGRKLAYAAVGQATVTTYWQIGCRIVEEEQNGKERAKYGSQLIKTLSSELMREFGSGFSKRNLEYARKVYLAFPDFQIVQTRLRNLTWSHLCIIASVPHPDAREWYLKEASEQMWSVRTLDRNVSTQYYGRRMASMREGLTLPEPQEVKDDPLAYIKNPVVAEFLGFRKDTKFDETQLEEALIGNLQQFIMELGRGFAFVDRQKHIYAGGDDYYIDLVFYNINLHCYVLFDLKTHKLSHQDVGQMDMYVRMYDELVKGETDSPTIGILLCSDTNEDVARYSILHDSDQLFAAKYMTYMPTQEELRREIEQQKEFFRLKNEK